MARETSGTRACLILAIRRGLIKVCSYCTCTLSLSRVHVHTHSLFFLRETYLCLLASKLLAEHWIQHCHTTNLLAYHLYLSSEQEKSSSMWHTSQLYMHLSDNILFLAATKSSRASQLLGMSLLPSPINQHSSAWLATLFFEQAEVLTKVNLYKDGATPFYWSHSSKISDVLCKINVSADRSLPGFL